MISSTDDEQCSLEVRLKIFNRAGPPCLVQTVDRAEPGCLGVLTHNLESKSLNLTHSRILPFTKYGSASSLRHGKRLSKHHLNSTYTKFDHWPRFKGLVAIQSCLLQSSSSRTAHPYSSSPSVNHVSTQATIDHLDDFQLGNSQSPELSVLEEFFNFPQSQHAFVGSSPCILSPSSATAPSSSTEPWLEAHSSSDPDTSVSAGFVDFLQLSDVVPSSHAFHDSPLWAAHSTTNYNNALPVSVTEQTIAPTHHSFEPYSRSTLQVDLLKSPASSSLDKSHFTPQFPDDRSHGVLQWSSANAQDTRPSHDLLEFSKIQESSYGARSSILNTVQQGRVRKDYSRTTRTSSRQNMERSGSDISESSTPLESADTKFNHIEDRRQRNNVAARKYRQKRLDRIAELEQALEKSEKEKSALQLQVERWKMKAEVFEEMSKKT